MSSVTSFNDKVDRCSRCNTFVRKGSAHTTADCNERIAKKEANRGKPRAAGSKRRYKMTPKRTAIIEKAVSLAYAKSAKKQSSVLKSLGL